MSQTIPLDISPSPFSVDNPVDNRFLVTETSPPFSQLH
jgi:hypothetical protein